MKNRCIVFSLVGLIIPIIFLACKDDLFFPQEQSEGVPNSSLTVRKAREIFEQFVSSDSLVLKKSRVEKPGLCPGDFTPIWDKANESADSLIECVDVPICAQFLYRGTFVSKEPSKKGETERYATDIFQKLLVVYDKRSRLTGCFIINLIPTKQYYNKHKNDVALRFANCENDFCGIVLYSYLKDNSTVRINVLRDGKAVKAASVYNNENTFEENHRIMRSFVEDGVVYRMPKATAARGGEYIGGGHGTIIWNSHSLPDIEVPGNRPDPEPEPEPGTDPEIPEVPEPDPNPGSGGGGGGGGSGENPTDPDEDTDPVIIRLNVSGSKTYTLLDEYTLSVSVSPANKNPGIFYYEMSRPGEGKWEGLNGATVKARFPGKFDLRAYAYIDYQPFYSNTIQVEHIFPSRDEILQAAQSHFDELWQKTLDDYSETSCREYGCAVYLDTQDGGKEDYIYEDIPGEIKSPDYTEISTPIHLKDFYNKDFSGNIKFSWGGKFGVACFHTHPPIEFASRGTSRPVGASSLDLSTKLPYDAPGIVYDYIGVIDPTDNKYYIYSGDKKDMEGMVYFYGSEKRPNNVNLE